MGFILLIVLILLLLGGLPRWGYSRNWGYVPSSLFGLLLGYQLFVNTAVYSYLGLLGHHE